MLNATVDLDDFRRLRAETVRVMGIATRRAVLEAGIAGADHARNHHIHKRRTGRATGPELRFRLLYGGARGAEGELINSTPYAAFIEYRTRPHIIRPKAGFNTKTPLLQGQTRRKRTDIGTHRVALRFYMGGRLVFRRLVRHPGSRAMPFMRPAAVYAGEQMKFETERVTFVLASALWE